MSFRFRQEDVIELSDQVDNSSFVNDNTNPDDNKIPFLIQSRSPLSSISLDTVPEESQQLTKKRTEQPKHETTSDEKQPLLPKVHKRRERHTSCSLDYNKTSNYENAPLRRSSLPNIDIAVIKQRSWQ